MNWNLSCSPQVDSRERGAPLTLQRTGTQPRGRGTFQVFAQLSSLFLVCYMCPVAQWKRAASSQRRRKEICVSEDQYSRSARSPSSTASRTNHQRLKVISHHYYIIQQTWVLSVVKGSCILCVFVFFFFVQPKSHFSLTLGWNAERTQNVEQVPSVFVRLVGVT